MIKEMSLTALCLMSLGCTTNKEIIRRNIDRSIMEVQTCLKEKGYKTRIDTENIYIEIRLDGHNSKGNEYFKCHQSLTGLCAGSISGNYLTVTPNLRALKHEVIHWNGYKEDYGKAQICQ